MSSARHPLALPELLDYWLAELPQAQSEAVEEHLFECTECGARLDAVRATADAIVGLVRNGGLTARATTALINRFARDRLNVRQYTIQPGEVVACTVSPHDDLLMPRLVVPAGERTRIDVAAFGSDGRELYRVEDVAFDVRAGHVITFLPARPVQNEPSGRRHFVLFEPPDRGGGEIARYTLDHTAMRES